MKLKVGDIEMDSDSGITVGAQPRPAAAREAARQPQAAPVKSGLASSAEEPPTVLGLPVLALSPVAYRAGALLLGLVTAALSTVGFYGILEQTPAWLALLPAPGLAYLTSWAVLAPRHLPQPTSPDTGVGLGEARARELRQLMLRAEGPFTVQRLMETTGWGEEAVAHALQILLDRRQITESLGADNSHWIYELDTAADDAPQRLDALPIHERLSALRSARSQAQPLEAKAEERARALERPSGVK